MEVPNRALLELFQGLPETQQVYLKTVARLILAQTHCYPPVFPTLSDVGEAMGLSKTTVYEKVKRLQASGWIVVAADRYQSVYGIPAERWPVVVYQLHLDGSAP